MLFRSICWNGLSGCKGLAEVVKQLFPAVSGEVLAVPDGIALLLFLCDGSNEDCIPVARGVSAILTEFFPGMSWSGAAVRPGFVAVLHAFSITRPMKNKCFNELIFMDFSIRMHLNEKFHKYLIISQTKFLWNDL